jgi:hypothetical protein
MSKGHYLDCIDDAFSYLTLVKQRNFVMFMVQQHKNTTKKLGEFNTTYCLRVDCWSPAAAR